MLKKLMFLSVVFLFEVCMAAAQEHDTVYLFRFKPEKDMFYVPYSGNDAELARLESCVERYKEKILSGEVPLYVDGHASTVKMAYTRSNRVKSELILRCQLMESCFITRNHADNGDYVTVSFTVPVAGNGDEEQDKRDKDDVAVEEPVAPDETDEPDTSGEIGDVEQNTLDRQADNRTAVSDERQLVDEEADAGRKFGLAVYANLLRWATLTPDLGIEWRINSNVGVAVKGSWTSWSWDNKNRRYALWEIAPEVRWYLGKERRGYVGAMYKAGSFNYKLSEQGRQGDIMGGGITGGYRLRLNNALSVDFSVGIGCLHAAYDKYVVIGGTRVLRGGDHKNWWGPVDAGITLVWQIF